ncbi:anthranilate synthase component II [Geoalkalibacter subterraneus]|jgi:anthranilate synthase component 2|uniref:Anthranilate synthase component II n=1 Tax=Geoalkalibacter subterraneus TaxID=483547 RepID=A0A0B5FUD4_9BACT|nr:aminodeoxychorismate/anthranilate synthase component II [Geoalkalibacter subterraneus]AJF07211.1 anthranilate synthase component II [Geoalkalibacter subterraneus]
MLLMIDNYDSFTYNLVQYFRELGEEVEIYRNDKISLEEIERKAPRRLVVSPGPCTPDQAGISVSAIRRFLGRIPTLGVCLGHQCIGQALGGRVVRAGRLMHGKTSDVFHDGKGLFAGIDNPFAATRYHSLIVERDTLPACLEISAWTEENEIMAVTHREQPLWGIQYHPESILTLTGKRQLENFLEMT